MIEDDGKEKTVDFGAKGMGDFTIYSKSKPEEAEKHKEKYIARHSKMGEDWNDPLTAGFWSRWLLWSKPTIQESLKDIKKRFGL